MTTRVRVTSRTLAWSLAGLVLGASAQQQDPLQACWRGQQTRITATDGSFRDQNADCVLQFDAKQARGRCHGDQGRIETLSALERVGPDRLRVTALDPATGAPKAPPSEMKYRIQDDWLLIERPLAPAPGAPAGARTPVLLQSVSVRVRPDASGKVACEPRGETGLRVVRTPKSSLVLRAPAGWKPLLIDPGADPRFGPMTGTNLLVGVFEPVSATATDRRGVVLVLDDVRPGPVPVRLAEFAKVKASFASDPGAFKFTCDEPDRLCGYLPPADGKLGYVEFVIVNGRVAMVHGITFGGVDALPTLQRVVAGFVEQLRAAAGR